MGFYTVAPASPNYVIGSATLNGQPFNKPWFAHADTAKGGTLVFKMGPKPNPDWGVAPEAAPPFDAGVSSQYARVLKLRSRSKRQR